MNRVPLKTAVVGHTNAGKTSLLRTLSRDASFGVVSDRPGSTRAAESRTLRARGEPVVQLIDTPGLEDASGLLDWLNEHTSSPERRIDGYERVRRFMESPEARGQFAQEGDALREVLNAQAALYVIDARDRVLGKHRDELEILSWCGRPIVPVLNFVAGDEANVHAWREMLTRTNLHAVAEFDTVVLSSESERFLFEKMRTLLDDHRDAFDALIAEREEERRSLAQASATSIGELMIDVAAFVALVSAKEKAEIEAALEAFRDRVRAREQQAVTELLELHRFDSDDLTGDELPIEKGEWGMDLFAPATMQRYGIRTGGAAGAGALIGLGIDAAVGGASLGAGALLGAAIGAVAGAAQSSGKRLLQRMRGRIELRVNDATLRVLLARQTELVRALFHRGHASTQPIAIGSNDRKPARSDSEAIRQARRARAYPEWSRLNVDDYRGGPSREYAIARVQDALVEQMATT